MRNGLPRDSRATARAVRCANSSDGIEQSEHERERLIELERLHLDVARVGSPSGQRSRISLRKALVSRLVVAIVITSRIGAAPGGRSRSSSSKAL